MKGYRFLVVLVVFFSFCGSVFAKDDDCVSALTGAWSQEELNEFLHNAVRNLDLKIEQSNIFFISQALDLDRINYLIAIGADVNSKMEDGTTALHFAGTVEIAKLLLDRGAYVNAKDVIGVTPLHFAQTTEIANLFIDRGAYVNARDSFNKTPLHFAKTVEMVNLLLDKGADVNARDKDGVALLHGIAEKSGHSDNAKKVFVAIANLLLDRGADINARDKYGRTPLYIAELFKDQTELINLLKERGAKY